MCMSVHLWAFLFTLPSTQSAAVTYGTVSTVKESMSCPCLTAASTGVNARKMITDLKVLNKKNLFNEKYGLEGCKGYDADIDVGTTIKCKGSNSKRCTKNWCYVDPDVCPVNTRECGKSWCYNVTSICKVGDPEDKYCRSRPRRSETSELASMGVKSSSETCGEIDASSVAAIWPEMAGSNLNTGWLESHPWNFYTETADATVADKKDKDGKLWVRDGILKSYWTEVLKKADMGVNYASPAVSQLSRDTVWLDNSFNSSWSSCVYDLAIGRLDFCMADFWVTARRLRQCNFLPSIYSDEVFLMEDSKFEESLLEILQKPFLPFAYDLWGFVLASLVVMGVLIAWAETGHNPEDYQDERCPMCFCKGVFQGVNSYLTSGYFYTAYPQTIHGMCFSLGLGFFVLLSLSTYTANLASFLILKKVAAGVNTLEDAVRTGSPICVSQVYLQDMIAKVPDLKGVACTEPPCKTAAGKPWKKCVLELHKGTARGKKMYGVIAFSELDPAYRGVLIERDCKNVPPGSKLPDCPANAEGQLDKARDCFIKKVGSGNILHTIEVAMATTHAAHHPVAFAHARAKAEGAWGRTMEKYDWANPPVLEDCPLEAADELDRMAMIDMVGTSVASSFLVFLGWCFMTLRIQIVRRCLRAVLSGCVLIIPKAVMTGLNAFSVSANAGLSRAWGAGEEVYVAPAGAGRKTGRKSVAGMSKEDKEDLQVEQMKETENYGILDKEKTFDEEMNNIGALVNTKLVNKLNRILGKSTAQEGQEAEVAGDVIPKRSELNQTTPADMSTQAIEIYVEPSTSDAPLEGARQVLELVRSERYQVEAMWYNILKQEKDNERDWEQLQSYRNDLLKVSPGTNVFGSSFASISSCLQREFTDQTSYQLKVERTLLDGQWKRLRSERDQLQADVREVRALEKECIAMWGEAEKYLLRSKLTADLIGGRNSYAC